MTLFSGKRLVVVALMTVGFLMAAAPAHAWYVDITITGGGRVYETTDANELDEHCTGYPEEGFSSPSTTPTGAVGATCRAGDASGDYGHGWVVRYVAEPAPGYRFDRWESDGRANPGPVLCDGSGGSPSYAGTACQFATFQNLQTRAVFVDDTAPAMAVVTGPTSQVNGPASFGFAAVADPTFAFFECRVTTGGEALVQDWHSCSSGVQKDPAPLGTEGVYKLYVRAVDHSANRSAPMSVSWTADKIAPETTVTGGPTGAVKSTSATFTFTGSADVASYTCTLDGVPITPCFSPRSYFGLNQGPHTFTVRATDDAGNVDFTPEVRTWTVDTVAPQTTITSGPDQGSVATSDSATFAFDANESATFECQLDGTGWTDCESPRSYNGLTEGPHTVAVRALDAAGNVDGSPDTRTWTVDTVQPETTISAGPANGATSPSQAASFAFGASEPGTFECQLDGGDWAGCVNPHAYTGLPDGPHTFAVRARDVAGNVDASPATRSWTVDTGLPETTITDGPAEGGVATSDAATFDFTSTEPGTFECRLDDAGWTDCASPHTYADLAEGDHTFAVKAIDAAGNVDASPASWAWSVDTVAPETTITTGPAGGAVSPSRAVTFAFAASEAGTFECQLDGAAWTACESPASYSGLAEGRHTFAARATDVAGNVDASPATRTWTVDVPLATMAVRSKLRTKVSDGQTTVRSLKLTGLPAGATVKVTCKKKSKGCAFKSKTLKPGASSVTLTKHFKKRKLSAGAVVTLRVTTAGYEPTAFRYKMRKGSKRPSGGKVARPVIEPVTLSAFGAG